MSSIDASRIEPYILEAQTFDLRPILNDALYYDFLKYFDDTAAGANYTKYQELLNGKLYSLQGNDIYFDGVKPLLAYQVLSRFVPSNQINVTRFGVVQKIQPQSEPVDTQLLMAEVKILKSNCMAYQAQVLKFLSNNLTTYPLYNVNQSCDMNSRTGFKFFRG